MAEDDKIYDQKIILGQIVSIDEDTGKVLVNFLTIQGQHQFNMPAPFFGIASWIRAYPEINSLVLVGRSQVESELRILQVLDISEQTRLLLNKVSTIGGKSTDEIQAVDTVARASVPKEGFPFRKLRQGEIEAVSSGHAEWWLSSTGETVSRSGIIRSANRSRMGLQETLATGHDFQGLDASQISNNDHIYFGVVRRATDEKVFETQKYLTTEALSKEISALLEDNSDLKAKWDKLVGERSALETTYTSQINSYLAKVKTIKSALGHPDSYKQVTQVISSLNTPLQALQEFRFNLEKQEVFGSTLGYSQADFTAGLKDLRLLQLNLEKDRDLINSSVDPLNKAYVDSAMNNLTSLTLVTVPALKLEDVFKTSIQSLADKKAKVTQTLETLLKTSEVEKEQVETRHIYKSILMEQNQFCKEYHVNISWKGSPKTLYDHKIGHVFDADGVREKNPTTQLPLRSREKFFCEDGTSTVIFVDSQGNVSHILSPSATSGYVLTVPKGNAKMTIGKDINVEVGREALIHVGSHCTIHVDDLLEVEAKDINFKSRNNITLQGKAIKLISETTTDIESAITTLKSTTLVEVAAPNFIKPN